MDTGELLRWLGVAVGFLLLFWILARVAYVEEPEETASRAKAEPPVVHPVEEMPQEPELKPLKIPPTIPHYGPSSGPMVLSAHGGGWSWPKRLNLYRRHRERPITGPPGSGE
jgi:hypothetical protein